MRRFTVKSLNEDIDTTLAARYSTIIVEGEVGELKTPNSGHCYMTLRDQDAAVSAVAWRSVWPQLQSYCLDRCYSVYIIALPAE